MFSCVTSNHSCFVFFYQVAQSIQHNIDINPDVTTVFQFALPEILEKSTKETFAEKNLILKQNVELVCDRLKDIPCVVCTKKPESCTYLLVPLLFTLLMILDQFG